jgi:hypothetical protein
MAVPEKKAKMEHMEQQIQRSKKKMDVNAGDFNFDGLTTVVYKSKRPAGNPADTDGVPSKRVKTPPTQQDIETAAAFLAMPRGKKRNAMWTTLNQNTMEIVWRSERVKNPPTQRDIETAKAFLAMPLGMERNAKWNTLNQETKDIVWDNHKKRKNK